ncbi:MAG: hypothetical protein ACR2J8_05575, partial [Thermomicrobiales bacterium]
ILPALLMFAIFVLLSQWKATEGLSLLFCGMTLILPLALSLRQRKRRRDAAAPNLAIAEKIRANPSSFFRGEPSLETVLAAAEYVATELQGKAILDENAWLAGGKREAARGASLRVPSASKGSRRN